MHASDALAEVLSDLLDRPARRSCIHGETGTGKGLLAEELHLATRPEAPFVSLHAATVPDARIHAVLFDEGLLARAHGGTLHLDGFDDASPPLQAALLQAVGDERLPDGSRLDVFVVTTTLLAPASCSAQGRLRRTWSRGSRAASSSCRRCADDPWTSPPPSRSSRSISGWASSPSWCGR